jgi:hypothetical protein
MLTFFGNLDGTQPTCRSRDLFIPKLPILASPTPHVVVLCPKKNDIKKHRKGERRLAKNGYLHRRWCSGSGSVDSSGGGGGVMVGLRLGLCLCLGNSVFEAREKRLEEISNRIDRSCTAPSN